jgi:chemotaxis family two-component system response regulator Rcp1
MNLIGGKGMPIEVLLVEDSPGDVRLTREAFGEAVHAHAPRPGIILLDLNLPKMDGRQVLVHIKEDPSLKTIPIVILTTSEAEVDIERSYQLQANCYLSKPVQLEHFEALVKSINDFWLTKVKLPQQGKAA